jgi:folylpolyglutamate synthase/dihydropteroate synthase
MKNETECCIIVLSEWVDLWQEKVEVAVIEVGLGGRLDATNALPNPVVSGISLLDLDHTAILGDTIEKIASEKVQC